MKWRRQGLKTVALRKSKKGGEEKKEEEERKKGGGKKMRKKGKKKKQRSKKGEVKIFFSEKEVSKKPPGTAKDRGTAVPGIGTGPRSQKKGPREA